jgi:hypothetical protein
MKRLASVAAGGTLLLGVFGVAVSAQQKPAPKAPAKPAAPTTTKQTGDPRVRAALEKAKINYEVTERGNFRVGFNFREDKLTQVAIILSDTSRLGDMEFRTVSSTAYHVKGERPAEVASTLLK